MGGRTGAHAMDAESTVTNRSSSACRRPPREKRISDIHAGAGGVAVKAPSNIRSRYSRLDVEQPVQVCPLAGDKEPRGYTQSRCSNGLKNYREPGPVTGLSLIE